jgi:Family of unknown function (DUF6298)/Protein of unknown function (DUF4038)/Putative collagen-binding domain of a collagenase
MAPKTLSAAVAAALLIGVVVSSPAAPRPEPRTGAMSLRVSKVNPRYFTNASGRAVFLTGSHVWWNLQGARTWRVDCERGRAAPFRYGNYLDHLTSHGHNFIRLWRIELTRWHECGDDVAIAPQPWRRSGPGRAFDGRPKFDLRRFDPAYFRRLRERVAAARRRGLYVSVMLFEGWSAQFERQPWRSRGHPFFFGNNVNGLDPDRNRDGTLHEIYTLAAPRIRRIQEAYVRKVIDTVGRYDNVLYEIANESGAFSIPWQYRMIAFVKRHERARGFRAHPVGMSFVHGHSSAPLYGSRADWVAPSDRSHLSDPPAANARKVVFSDTDHHCGGCGDETFPWRTFMRGYNPIFMDEMTSEPRAEAIRRAMGATLRAAKRIDLLHMAPRGDLCSTWYCLVRRGREYLVYQSGSGPFLVDLSGGRGRRFALEWMHPLTGAITRAADVEGGAARRLTPPYDGAIVAHLKRR